MKIYGNFVYTWKLIAKKGTSYVLHAEPFGGITALLWCRDGGTFPKGKHTSFVMNIMSAETNGTTSYSVYVK